MFRSAADEAKQAELLADVTSRFTIDKMPSLQLLDNPSPSLGFSYGYRGFDSQCKDKLPPLCISWATSMHESFRRDKALEAKTCDRAESDKRLHLSKRFNPISLWSRAYKAGEKLGVHLDPGNDNFVFIVNIGRAVSVIIGLTSIEALTATPIVLNTGDAIFFNGSVLYHGVSDIHGPETAPQFWDEEDYVRIGLQMREQVRC